jgi:WD40 repeat protein
MKKILSLIIASCFSFSLHAQHQADKWFFGNTAGLDFTGGSPVVISGDSLNTSGGSAVMCDTSGNLLFYTDGMTVRDSSHHVMPNGSGLLGGIASQSALIVPLPGSDSLYFIFTVDAAGGPNGFRASLVDMSLQAGLGDVVSGAKNISIRDSVAEKLTAVRQFPNQNNYWIATHRWGSDAFEVYSLTSAGLFVLPIVSHAGIIYPDNVISSTFGQMKFSPCGDKIATAGYLDTVEVFDFDAATGIVSNPVTIPMPDHTFGIEFSVDGQKIYVSSTEQDSTLIQYDLAAGNTAAIIASRVVLSGTPDIRALQIGNDQKIYVAKSFSQFFGVINDPTLSGTAANYVDNAIDLDPLFMGVTAGLGLPGFVQSYFKTTQSCLFTNTHEIKGEQETILYPNPSTGEFTLQFSKENRPSEILIYDQAGRMIMQNALSAAEVNLSFGKSLAPGIYFIRLRSDRNMNVLKAIKIR